MATVARDPTPSRLSRCSEILDDDNSGRTLAHEPSELRDDRAELSDVPSTASAVETRCCTRARAEITFLAAAEALLPVAALPLREPAGGDSALGGREPSPELASDAVLLLAWCDGLSLFQALFPRRRATSIRRMSSKQPSSALSAATSSGNVGELPRKRATAASICCMTSKVDTSFGGTGSKLFVPLVADEPVTTVRSLTSLAHLMHACKKYDSPEQRKGH